MENSNRDRVAYTTWAMQNNFAWTGSMENPFCCRVRMWARRGMMVQKAFENVHAIKSSHLLLNSSLFVSFVLQPVLLSRPPELQMNSSFDASFCWNFFHAISWSFYSLCFLLSQCFSNSKSETSESFSVPADPLRLAPSWIESSYTNSKNLQTLGSV